MTPTDQTTHPQTLPTWLAALELLGPQILAFTPLARIAPHVIAGIQEANAIAGATGADKLAHVMNLSVLAAQAANEHAGHQVIDPQVVANAAAAAISAVVNIAKLAHGTAVATKAIATAAASPTAKTDQ